MSDWYQIENNSFIVQVDSMGGEIKRLFSKLWHRELLWLPRDEQAKKIWKRCAPILFPIVGKLKQDQYNFQGKSYQMPQHGFARDKDFKCLECGTNEMEFTLEADQDTFKNYPFCFELRVQYLLDDATLTISYSVKNTDRQDIYFSIGGHPAFATEQVENYEIHFEKVEKGYFQLEEGLVNWDQMELISSSILKPSKELFANDALVFKNLKSNYVDLVNLKRHEVIRIHGTNTPYFGIWGKGNVPFVCLEPWYGVSDDASHDQNLETKKGIQKLAMGKTFKFSYSIELLRTDTGGE